jgi:uncharacterized protein (TIGR02145 family)
MKNIINLSVVILLLLFIHSCNKEVVQLKVPVLTTTKSSLITQTSASCGGNISNDGGASVIDRGVCWSKSDNPTIADSKTSDGSGTGSFISSITGLTPGTRYYVKAYASNSAGTGYGDVLTFSSLPHSEEAYPGITGETAQIYLEGELVTCQIINGEYIYQGDIILEPEQLPASKGAGLTAENKRWPYCTVYYSVNSNLPDQVRITDAIAQYQDNTPLVFIPRTDEPNYIEFLYDSEGCSSPLGMVSTSGKHNIIRIADWGSTGTVIHEIGHSIGLLHEQCKSGRDNYVTILWDNIIDSYKNNFNEYPKSLNTSGFDFNSIMLYDSWAFQKDASKPTMTKKDGATFTSNRETFSDSDRTLINLMYFYKSITIGTQTWMAENLRTTRYNDGTPIPYIEDILLWSALSNPGYCWYNNDRSAYESSYGALYTWFAIDSKSNGGKNVCPKGWHVPSDEEWHNMVLSLDANAVLNNDSLYESSVAGSKLKETGTDHWLNLTGSTNETGFTALPGGMRDANGAYANMGIYGYWWASTEINFDDVITGVIRNLDHVDKSILRSRVGKRYGFSVRCLKDN